MPADVRAYHIQQEFYRNTVRLHQKSIFSPPSLPPDESLSLKLSVDNEGQEEEEEETCIGIAQNNNEDVNNVATDKYFAKPVALRQILHASSSSSIAETVCQSWATLEVKKSPTSSFSASEEDEEQDVEMMMLGLPAEGMTPVGPLSSSVPTRSFFLPPPDGVDDL